MADRSARLKKGQKVALWATLLTLLASLMKGSIGVLFNSKVLIADAFHSGADTIAIFASAFGLWLASKEKSARFPYGLYKAETFITLIIGGLITWAGIELVKDGYHKLFFTPEVTTFPYLPVMVTILSIITAFFIARWEKAVGEEINSRSLIANAGESFLDIISSIVVLCGILMAYLQIPYVEGLIIILIALLIIKLGVENFWKSMLVLLDANLDKQLQSEIEELVSDIYGLKDVQDVKIRQSGPFRMVDLKFTTSPSITIYKAHEISDEIEHKIMQKFDTVESVFVHAEPSKQENVRAIIPVAEINGEDSKIYSHFGRAPYFAIIEIQKDEIQIEDFYLNEFLDREKHIGLNVVKVVIHYDLDMLFTNRIGEISFYMLKENFIDIYQVEDDNLTIRHVVEHYRDDRLKRITEPTHSVEDALVES